MVVCASVVVAYQATRPAQVKGDPRVFVPSADFYLDFSPSFRTSLADLYFLSMVQYYGEHVSGDGRFDSLPQMVDLVTRLSPRFTRAYFFAEFALLDAKEPGAAYEVLLRGFKENPQDWRFPAHLGFFAYVRQKSGQGHNRRRVVSAGGGDPRQSELRLSTCGHIDG